MSMDERALKDEATLQQAIAHLQSAGYELAMNSLPDEVFDAEISAIQALQRAIVAKWRGMHEDAFANGVFPRTHT